MEDKRHEELVYKWVSSRRVERMLEEVTESRRYEREAMWGMSDRQYRISPYTLVRGRNPEL